MQVNQLKSKDQIIGLHETGVYGCWVCNASLGSSKLDAHEKFEEVAQEAFCIIKEKAYGPPNKTLNYSIKIPFPNEVINQHAGFTKSFLYKGIKVLPSKQDALEFQWDRSNPFIYGASLKFLTIQANPPTKRNTKLWKNALKGIDCDFTIISKEDEKIPVHKCVIKAYSKHFKRALETKCKESLNSEIKFSETSKKALLVSLQYIYTASILTDEKTDPGEQYSTQDLLEIFDFSEYIQKRKLSAICTRHIDTWSTVKEKQDLLLHIQYPVRFQNILFLTTMLFWANAIDPLLGSFMKGIHNCSEDSYTKMQQISQEYSLDKVQAALNTYRLFAFHKPSDSYNKLGASLLASSSLLNCQGNSSL